MAKPEWGMKRTCQGCSARFYDLQRDPIVCPVCSTVYDPEKQPRVRRGSSVVRDEPVLVPAAVKKSAEVHDGDVDLLEDDTDDVEIDDVKDDDADSGDDEIANEDSELMEDTSELGEDDDDIGEVMEHVDDDMGDKS